MFQATNMGGDQANRKLINNNGHIMGMFWEYHGGYILPRKHAMILTCLNMVRIME